MWSRLTARGMKLRASVIATAIIALAFFLRVYRLADNNIWWDEGWTIWLSRHDLGWIALRTASDEHPPLHYWLIHVWNVVTGTDALGLVPTQAPAFAARFVSVFFGLLTVALLYRIGRKIGGNNLGLLAALLLTLARFHVWWSQDIKNYTLSGFFALASVWFVLLFVVDRTFRRTTNPDHEGTPLHAPRTPFWGPVRAWSRGETGSRGFAVLTGYVLSITLALYSHYLAALIFLADNLFVLVLLLREWLKERGEGQPRVVAPTLQWIIAQGAVLALYAPWLALYWQNAATWSAAPAFDFGLFLRLAATVFALGVTTYIDNYFWVVLGFTLLAALSAAWVVRQGPVARGQEAGVRGQGAENRGQGSGVSSQPQDLHSGSGTVVSSQRRDRSSWSGSEISGQSPVLRPPSSPLRTQPSSLSPQSFSHSATPAIARGTSFALVIVLVPVVLIYVLSLTPAAVFAPKIQARYLLILLPAYMLLMALGILFLFRFSRYVAAAALVLIAVAQAVTLGDYFHQRVLHDDYFTMASVIDSFALPGDGVVLDTDQEWPTFLYYLRQPLPWVGVPNGAGVDVAGAHRVAAEAQQYRAVWVVTIPDALDKDPQHLVEAELAHNWTKQYEQTFGDKRLALYASQIRNVKDVPPENFSPQFVLSNQFDSRLTLGGVDLPVSEAQPGDTVHVVTYWASQDLANVRIELRRADGVTLTDQTIPISIGAHERAEADLVIPPDAVAGEVSVFTQARLAQAQIGSLRILPREVGPVGGAVTHPLDFRLGDSIHLTGQDLPQTQFYAGDPSIGSGVPLTLFWKTDRALPRSYTAFVHLLGAQYNPAQNNFLWGQVDGIPVQGRMPTSAWTVGQLVADPYVVPIKSNAPRGLYKIEVGLYEAASGTRLPVFDANGQSVGDSVVVGEVEIQ